MLLCPGGRIAFGKRKVKEENNMKKVLALVLVAMMALGMVAVASVFLKVYGVSDSIL